jgi:hypothetical protein
MNVILEIKWGNLKLKTLSLTWNAASGDPSVKATHGAAQTPTTCAVKNGRVKIQFPLGLTITTGEKLSIEIA